METKFTIKDFNTDFPDDKACLAFMWANRYGDLKTCPKCQKEAKFYPVTKRKCYSCQWCSFQIHPLAFTIFHKSDTPLKTWFYAIFLFANSKNGVSAKELQRQLGVTYKCAWRMAYKIRLLMSPEGRGPKLFKIVEVDETYIGGRARGKTGRGASNKTTVFGLLQRNGRLRAGVVPDVKEATLLPLIKKNVEESSTIMSDEFLSYRNLRQHKFFHKTVNHSEKEYARYNVHVNSLEGFWSQLKRSLNGTYHAVSPKHLNHYVDEFSYRYSKRKNGQLFSGLVVRASRLV